IWRAERSLLRANTLSPGRRPTTVRRKITDATIDAKTREETGRFECGGTEGPCRPAQAGIQGKSGAPCAQRPIGVGEQYRCSPPSEPYGRFSRIRLSGQWLSTSRLALKSVS